jgi:hypothetical protein
MNNIHLEAILLFIRVQYQGFVSTTSSSNSPKLAAAAPYDSVRPMGGLTKGPSNLLQPEFKIIFVQDGAPKIAKLPYKWLYGRYNYS